MGDRRRRRALVRPRHGGQQRAALGQLRGAGRGAAGARRQARLQREGDLRNRRGNRFAGPGPSLRRAPGCARGRCIHCFGRAARIGGAPHAVSRIARCHTVRVNAESARRRASLGQLGRRAEQPGDRAVACDRQPRRSQRTHRGRWPASAADLCRRARSAFRHRAGPRRELSRYRPELGRTGPHADRTRDRLEYARSARDEVRQPRCARQCDPAHREGGVPAALRRRHGLGEHAGAS